MTSFSPLTCPPLFAILIVFPFARKTHNLRCAFATQPFRLRTDEEGIHLPPKRKHLWFLKEPPEIRFNFWTSRPILLFSCFLLVVLLFSIPHFD